MDQSTVTTESVSAVDRSSNVHQIEVEGRQVFLVGTAHVSRESIAEVRRTIEAVRPDTVCVELDESRYRNLIDNDRWKKTNIFSVIRKGQAALLLSSLIMTSFQRRIGKKLGVLPGAELAEAVRAAEEVGARLELADRDIQITLKRTWGNLGFGKKIQMMSQLAASVFVSEDIDEKMIEELKQGEKLADVLDMLAAEFPMVKEPLIDERDRYLAEKIRTAPGQRIVAVVGAGHVPGILAQIHQPHELAPLEALPSRSAWTRVLKWAIPVVIVGLFVYGFFTAGSRESFESVAIWAIINGLFAAAGAAAALGHPLTVLAAFLSAPAAALHPLIAVGWISGLVQAAIKKPKVQDLEDLPEDITSARGFWKNPVSRILLVVVFSNLGSILGTLIAGTWLAARILGSG